VLNSSSTSSYFEEEDEPYEFMNKVFDSLRGLDGNKLKKKAANIIEALKIEEELFIY
jgi:1,4-dihydroxy-2-naphthoate octaprenyltransferase